jgi:hypothetical protein
MPRIQIAFLSLLALASPARADVPPPDAEPCLSKKAGDDCSFQGKSGRCEAKKCTRASPTGSTEYDCLLCTLPTSSDGGCSSMGPGARHAAPLGLVGALAMIALRWRRRRR